MLVELRNLAAILFILYGSIMRPKLPNFIIAMFDSGLFRVLVITLVAYMANNSLQFSILLAVGFVLIITLINEQLIMEGFLEGFEESTNDEAEVEPITTIPSSLVPMKKSDVKAIADKTSAIAKETEMDDKELEALKSMAGLKI